MDLTPERTVLSPGLCLGCSLIQSLSWAYSPNPYPQTEEDLGGSLTEISRNPLSLFYPQLTPMDKFPKLLPFHQNPKKCVTSSRMALLAPSNYVPLISLVFCSPIDRKSFPHCGKPGSCPNQSLPGECSNCLGVCASCHFMQDAFRASQHGCFVG